MDGHDPEWPRWYAEYIVTRLPELGLRGDTETLAEELRAADASYRTSGSQEPWQEFYARWFVEELRSEPRNGA